jgi:hypothetical protein
MHLTNPTIQQLEKMNAPMDDREIDRILQRQKMRASRFREEL